MDSEEFQGLFLSQNRVDISLLYFDMLQRDPDAGGFSNWVEVLNSGVSLTSVIDGFLNSPEYQAIAILVTAAGTIDRRRLGQRQFAQGYLGAAALMSFRSDHHQTSVRLQVHCGRK